MRRLSIIDLSTGHQPIPNEDESLWIVFNGEIYNYKELRAELLAEGRIFKTHSDTEVILQMYEAYGPKSVSRLRGMFAFSIYDKETGKVFIARDFFGIKPLYYWKEGNEVKAFGSEIKSILEHPEYKKETESTLILTRECTISLASLQLASQHKIHNQSSVAYAQKKPPSSFRNFLIL